jgi:streptomycin 6-kinase
MQHDSDEISYFDRWQLTPDGAPFTTRSSRLVPVLHKRAPAMLKIAIDEEERAGGAVMAWWSGRGAAPVIAHDANAVLLVRAEGGRSLSAMARGEQDEAATQVICETIVELHAPRAAPRPTLVPLSIWFQQLEHAAKAEGGIFKSAWAVAEKLLHAPNDVRTLHGDIHHDNILDFGPLGWLAIDPKGLWGERGFDYANLFRNPDGTVALQAGRFEHRVGLVSKIASMEPRRLLNWILAVMGLSASWHLADAEPPVTTLTVAARAAAALGVTVA